MLAPVDQRPAVGNAPKALIPFTVDRHVLAEKRGAWKAKRGSTISMSIGSVVVRVAGSPLTFNAEAIIVFASETDRDPSCYVRLPAGKFNAPLFDTDGKSAKDAKAELDSFADRAAGAFLEWFEKQSEQLPIDDPTIAVGLIGTGSKRGVSVKKIAK